MFMVQPMQGETSETPFTVFKMTKIHEEIIQIRYKVTLSSYGMKW